MDQKISDTGGETTDGWMSQEEERRDSGRDECRQEGNETSTKMFPTRESSTSGKIKEGERGRGTQKDEGRRGNEGGTGVMEDSDVLGEGWWREGRSELMLSHEIFVLCPLREEEGCRGRLTEPEDSTLYVTVGVEGGGEHQVKRSHIRRERLRETLYSVCQSPHFTCLHKKTAAVKTFLQETLLQMDVFY